MSAHPPQTLDAATEAAVGWLVTLHSGNMSRAEQHGFDAWLQASPQHRDAWERLAAPLGMLLTPARKAANTVGIGSLLGDTLAHAESRIRQRRRLLRGALAVGGVATAVALVAERYTPLAQIHADLRTGTGQRSNFTLPDGSQITLDARSAADIDFRPGHRRVTLRQGALIAQATPTQAVHAPFVVATAHGQVRALGTRFVVRKEAQHSYVGMLEHSVEITAADGQRRELVEGCSARFGVGGITAVLDAPDAASAWQHGMLEVHDQPLGEVVQALRAYRPGILRVAPEATALRVYGSYALDDTDRALAALAETLPISVRTYQRGWLVVVEAASGKKS
ncbi:FecR family protein [Rhodoferax sp. OV413]|uniref:FecR domain-containing protein n=1 Tax=Rhodoferax sp. OV413 TaxID=1855285 RepID=UPI00088C07EB|nr:FecR domain-containing protein [Rhodoferax sp. OV413]SDO87308.1 FecR family protein [Rhodoferax sp. OV413]